MIKHFRISLFLLLFALFQNFTEIKAQHKVYVPPSEQNTVSVHALALFGGFLDKSVMALGAGAAVSYRQKKHCWIIRLVGLTELSIGMPNESDQGIDAGLLYGIEHRMKRWKLAAAAGAGYFSYIEYNYAEGIPGMTNGVNIKTKKKAVGFPLQGSVNYQPGRYGIGLCFGGNLNSARSVLYGGYIFTLRF